MSRQRKPRLSPSMIVALLALFVAMGGTGYAALKLPRNSVGDNQIKPNAVTSSDVKDRSLLAKDFKAGQLPAGRAGAKGDKGDKGDPCLPIDPACRGPRGDTGPQGPGTLSYDSSFPADDQAHVIATVNGAQVTITCSSSTPDVTISVSRVGSGDSLEGWGTQSNGSSVIPVHVLRDGHGHGVIVNATDTSGVGEDLDMVVRSAPSGETGKWARLDVRGDNGHSFGCLYEAMVIPPS